MVDLGTLRGEASAVALDGDIVVGWSEVSEDSPHAFWIILAAMLAIVVAVAAFFRRRGWL